ncbi:WYL domain-containing protein [Chitinilyticum piscinae]|uniref:WYL domain-containing protein n=1 Tax=Chitinilyticum piscinae TaxID=2866724 RepID=A0A8J7FK73_9NEIS|nr:WYL domain-containing protein [Chitinilyticum piscinae]MBE9610975.1 WYL domain-containing protein [Chitinilyticum piscinae]
MNHSEQLSSLSQSQRERLALVELRLWFVGDIRRQDIVDRFGVKSAAASRDLALYKELAPCNIDYDAKAKAYVYQSSFVALFEHATQRVLSWLTEGFGDGSTVARPVLGAFEAPASLSTPSLDVLAAVTRSICARRPLQIRYHSISSGETERVIVPFALVDTGLRWHIRAFDRKSREFRDFVVTRIEAPARLNEEPQASERYDNDIQWTRIVELELVPHPDQPHPEITKMDYGMVGGSLRMKLRAATAGYILRQWSVDCSPDHSLRGPEYRLWLKDHLALYGVKNAVLAPGYAPVDAAHAGADCD